MISNQIHVPGQEPIVIKGVVHGDELIEEMERKMPKRKTSKEYKEWKRTVNLIIDTTNKIAGFKRYTPKK